MPKKQKRTAKQKREENRAKILDERLKKSGRQQSSISTEIEVSEEKPKIDENFSFKDSDNNAHITSRQIIEIDRIKKAKSDFEYRKNSNASWQSKMPVHEVLAIPAFLTSESEKAARLEVVQKLRDMLKQRFLLSEMADVLLYNDYESLDKILSERAELCKVVTSVYPTFVFGFKKKAGSDVSKEYASEEKRMKAIIDFLEAGNFISSKNKNAFQDTVSSIVDTPKFNAACRIETEFLISELDTFVEEAEKSERRSELSALISRASAIQYELSAKKEAYETIEELVNSKKNMQIENQRKSSLDER